MTPGPARPPRAALIEEACERIGNEEAGAVVIARVADPSKLLDARPFTLHKDVVESLVDLVVALLDEEDHEGQSP